jgi:hypothetical protein
VPFVLELDRPSGVRLSVDKVTYLIPVATSHRSLSHIYRVALEGSKIREKVSTPKVPSFVAK